MNPKTSHTSRDDFEADRHNRSAFFAFGDGWIRAFSIHLLTSGDRARWLFLEEKATEPLAFCKEQNRKCCSFFVLSHSFAKNAKGWSPGVGR
jgi:hypothetical protein